jgi:hypothetical protein
MGSRAEERGGKSDRLAGTDRQTGKREPCGVGRGAYGVSGHVRPWDVRELLSTW